MTRTLGRRAADRLVRTVCRGLLGIFFRRVAVVGAERVPGEGPLVVVANHVNGLLDPMFVFGPLGLPARVLGKSTVWKIPVIAQLADLAGAIPVYRREDPGVDPSRNVESFAAAHRVLARGGILSIFPEGTSHDEPHLLPLKSGAARIVLGAELARAQAGEPPLGVRILPAGLLFEQRATFRSRVLVAVGEPLDPVPEIALAATDLESAVRRLTGRIAQAIHQLTLNYASWEEARLVELGADVLDRERRKLPEPERWKDALAMRRTLAHELERLRERHPAELADAVAAARDYEALLDTAGVTDDEARREVPLRLAVGFFLRSAARLLLVSPLALAGTLLNLVPWWIVSAIAARFRDEPNQISTFTLFPGLVLYPTLWIGEAIAAGERWGSGWGWAAGLAGPLFGWVALRWHEGRRRLWRETRAFLKLRRHDLAAELRSRRRRVADAIERLAAAAREAT